MNTELEVIPYEVKIKKNGILNSDRDYGDIDILAFDHKLKMIYSIECKNTKQAKIMYDFYSHSKNYIEKQLPKHLNRDKWLNQNRNKLQEVFSIEGEDYEIISLIISSHLLPVKYMQKISIHVYSFNEIKEKSVFRTKNR